ncbi:amino acid ABC transporter substrate-binding protein [Alteromonas sediminis]|uniref:Amino acid ABC transporter substrate-binding protein n=1 Tax=Alteromonas sediminis TaxID=2259342 RepID=A0A3N5Y5L9_9ALTE|nr:transporter substrate-binding domain-containing protein [Alteromonas sediminis]RPJ68436.1 amino acid ABC transporter substrate-binding protein [Alteromonas sediminis]
MLKFVTFFFVALAVLLPQQWASAAVWSITYPRPLSAEDKRHEYPLAVLTLALEKTGVRYQLMPSDRIILQAKSIRQLAENREIDVIWSMTNKQREEVLLPIRIPIAKGLIGWRVSLINKDDSARFSAIDSLAQLQQFSPIQGADWPDTKILQANGFSVYTVTEYTDANEALILRQGDFFPRSVMEVTKELEALGRGSDLMLEPDLVLQYPAAMYFFVNKSNHTLAKLIQTGLQKAVDSGEYDKLFQETFEPVIDDLNLRQRRRFKLNNPLMPEDSPVDDTALWFDIEK